jgi:hypothetical protein
VPAVVSWTRVLCMYVGFTLSTGHEGP